MSHLICASELEPKSQFLTCRHCRGPETDCGRKKNGQQKVSEKPKLPRSSDSQCHAAAVLGNCNVTLKPETTLLAQAAIIYRRGVHIKTRYLITSERNLRLVSNVYRECG